MKISRIRTIAQRYDAGASLSVGILPNSVWDLRHRPAPYGGLPLPPGMVEVGPIWAQYYLASKDGTAWPNTLPLSKYNAVPLSGADGYSAFDMAQLALNAGLRLPSLQEFIMLAYGLPQGNIGGSARVNTGSSEVYVSCHVDQPGGNLWQVIADYFARADGTWNLDTRNNGKDSAFDHGQIQAATSDFRIAFAGGSVLTGLAGGSRCLDLSNNAWSTYSLMGLRCVCPGVRI